MKTAPLNENDMPEEHNCEDNGYKVSRTGSSSAMLSFVAGWTDR
jgi:hypothetical protein